MPKASKPTAAQKKELKKKDAFEKVKETLTVGDTGVVLSPTPSSDDGTAEQQLVDVPPTLPEQNKVEIKRVIKKVKALEHQIEIAYAHSAFAVPTEIMDGLGKQGGSTAHLQNMI